MKLAVQLAALAAGALLAASAHSAAIFLTGHDPDFHAEVGPHGLGAVHINQIAIGFVTNPTNNTFSANGISKFLFVESSIAPPAGHVVGKQGIINSGFTEGVHFDHVNAGTLNAALNGLGTTYNALVIASDFGGILTSGELNILNARSGDIVSFLNSGGGLYAMAESNHGAGLTPGGGHFNYLPFIVSSTPEDQTEDGYAVTAFGASLGLTNDDVNHNFSHNVFDQEVSYLQAVDRDAQGRIVSLAGVVDTIPEPSTYVILGIGFAALLLAKRRKAA